MTPRLPRSVNENSQRQLVMKTHEVLDLPVGTRSTLIVLGVVGLIALATASLGRPVYWRICPGLAMSLGTGGGARKAPGRLCARTPLTKIRGKTAWASQARAPRQRQ